MEACSACKQLPTTPPMFRMEITRREDIGADLKAPSAARGGGVTGSYVLLPAVQTDDLVIHYDSRREGIVGGERPSELRGASADLLGCQGKLRPPRGGATTVGSRGAGRVGSVPRPSATGDDVGDPQSPRRAAGVPSSMQDQAAGQPIYFPWIPYRDTLRTFQSYLVKMPQDAISLFPKLRALVDEAAGDAPRHRHFGLRLSRLGQAVIDAAGKVARRGGGQGFQLDQDVKMAVEVTP